MRGMVAREQQVVTIVDPEIERLILVGATAAARRGRQLMQHNPMTFVDQTHCRAQPSDACSNDTDRCSAHATPYRRRAPSMRSRLTFIRGRGGAKPRASKLSKSNRRRRP